MMKYITSSIFILSVLILCFTPAAADIIKVWDAENNTAWIYNNGILRGQVESGSITSDLTYFQETLFVTAHNSDYVFDIQDFQYTFQYVKSNVQITSKIIEKEISESYIVTVTDYGDVQHNQIIPDIQSYNDISDTWTPADGLDLGGEDSIFKYEVNFIHPENGTTIGIIGFDSYEIITSNPLKLNFIWSVYEVIGNHDEEWTREVWRGFNPQGKTLLEGTTYHVRVTLVKQAEIGPISILAIPSIFGADIEELTYWNTSFPYRKPITITTNGTSTPDNYQVLLNISYDSEMQADFDDIRFTNSSNGELSYWIESKVDSTYANVWINLSDAIVDPGSDTVWMYYGNTGIGNASDGNTTFIIFDDLDSLNDWSTQGGTWSVSGGELIRDTSSAWVYLRYNTVAPTGNYILESKYNKSGRAALLWDSNNPMVYTATMSIDDNLGTIMIADDWSLGASDTYSFDSAIYYVYSMYRISGAQFAKVSDISRNLIAETGTSIDGSGTGRYFGFAYCTASSSVDWILIRKYIANESVTSYGAAEYYTNSLHYNSTSNYNHTIESDGTITANQTVYSVDDTNDTVASTGTSYLILNEYNNSNSTVRNFTFTGDNLDWYQAANLSYGFTLNNASGVIESQNAVGGLVNFTTNLIPGTYTIEIIQPPQNLTNITEQTQICYNWDDYANADYWNISQRIPSIPYTDVIIVLDGVKDAEFTDRAHTWILDSPNPTGTNGDKELISWIRNSTTLSGYADGEDDDILPNDDSFTIMLDMTGDGLTADDRQFILSESGTVTAKRGPSWLPQATNAVGVVIGAGVAGSIQYEMQIPISELSSFTNGSTIKLAMARKDTSQNPDVTKYYPKGLINDTDPSIWTSINLTAESEYTFLGNTTLSTYTVTGLTLFTWYRHRFSTINGSAESSYVYSNDITEDSPQYTVSGYILTEADLPISGATVWSVCDCGCVCEVETSNATGYYQGDCFYNGTYTIYAIAQGFLENSTVVIVSGANRSNQNITLTLTPSITISPAPPVQYDEFDLPLLLYIFIISFLYLFIVFNNGVAATELSMIYLLFIFFVLLFQTISLSVNYIYIPAFIFLYQVSITGINLERKGGD